MYFRKSGVIGRFSVALVLMAVVVGGVLGSGSNLGPGLRDGWKLYQNDVCGFEVRYPPGGVVSYQAAMGVRIDLPFASGTTLCEKYLLISVEAAGTALFPQGSEEVVLGGMKFCFEKGVEGAAGSIYEFFRYTARLESKCQVSFTFVLHSVNQGVFDFPPPAFDWEKETAVFQGILATFLSY